MLVDMIDQKLQVWIPQIVRWTFSVRVKWILFVHPWIWLWPFKQRHCSRKVSMFWCFVCRVVPYIWMTELSDFLNCLNYENFVDHLKCMETSHRISMSRKIRVFFDISHITHKLRGWKQFQTRNCNKLDPFKLKFSKKKWTMYIAIFLFETDLDHIER